MKQYPKYKDSKIPWIGDVPEHWNVLRLKGIALLFFKGSGITRDDVFEDGDTPCVRYGDIYTKYNISFSQCLTRTNKARLSSCVYLHHGDIAFTLTGELVEEIGKSIVYLGFEKCLVGGDIAVLRHSQNPSFLGYYLSSFVAQQQKSFGKSKLKVVHTKIGDLKNVIVSLPPADEQQAIVDFLDAAVDKIDRYIAAKESEIEKLGTLKQSVISRAVTQGLDPDVPMKDSKIPWIGEIPKHWEYKKINLLFSERCEKNHPNEPILCSTQKFGVIPQSMYENRVVVVNKGFDGLKLVCIGDFVISLRSFQGGIEYAYYRGIISAAYTVLSLKNNIMDANYIRLLFKSHPFIQLLQTCVTGIREGQNINYSLLRKQFLPVPPTDEQQAIVEYIEEQVQKIDTSINNIRQQIDKLKIYKQRLISDAVTGKIDVRERLG